MAGSLSGRSYILLRGVGCRGYPLFLKQMTTTQELTLLRADLKRPDLRHTRPWMRARIRELKAELRQEHKAFMRVLKLWPQVPEMGRKPGLVTLSCDDWIGPRRVRYTQNCEINPDL